MHSPDILEEYSAPGLWRIPELSCLGHMTVHWNSGTSGSVPVSVSVVYNEQRLLLNTSRWVSNVSFCAFDEKKVFDLVNNVSVLLMISRRLRILDIIQCWFIWALLFWMVSSTQTYAIQILCSQSKCFIIFWYNCK